MGDYGTTLPSGLERQRLEELADQIEAVARVTISRDTYAYKTGMHECNVSNALFSMAWDIKCMARSGTASYGV